MYFKTEDKVVVKAINDVLESHKTYRDGVVKLLEEFGADSAGQFSDGRIAGFDFKDGSPEGWRKPHNSTGYIWPKKSNKEAWEKINALPQLISHGTIAKTINFSEQFGAKRNGLASLIFCPACHVHEQIAYFKIDDDLTFDPPDHFVEILDSEYNSANKK